MYQLILGCITAAGLLGCVTFVIRYAIRSKGSWRRSEAGRFMMIVYANLGSLFALILANQIVGVDWPGRRPLTLILFSAYVVFCWWPHRLLNRAYKLRAGDSDRV